MRRASSVLILLVGVTAVLFFHGPPGHAAPCSVPSTPYPTIQDAVDDPGCDPVLLGSRTYSESVAVARSVTVQGVTSIDTVIRGQVTVLSGTVALNGLSIDTSGIGLAGRFNLALLSENTARVSGTDLVVVHKAMLFGNGFETSDTSAWSATVP